MIECRICHKKVDLLTTHLRRAHKMPKKIYADLFHTTEFVSAEAQERFRKSHGVNPENPNKGGRPKNVKTK